MTSSTRAPAVAGAFYPEATSELTRMLKQLCPAAPSTQSYPALLVPHAGYMYSGTTAGKVYGAAQIPSRVVLLGPNHTGRGRRISIWAKGAWQTPLGSVAIDEPLADLLLEALAEKPDTEAHRYEHSLEVQVPFLQWRNSKVSIVPITLGSLSVEACLRVGDTIASVLAKLEGTAPLLVLSTDMTHFLSAAEADRLDHLALEQVERVDPQGLYQAVTTHDISMCGFIPTTVGMQALRRQKVSRSTLLHYSHSGEVSGDFRKVVGYAGAVFEAPTAA